MIGWYSADLKKTPAKPLSFNFDEVFTEDKNNQYVYERIGENVVENAMSGYHGYDVHIIDYRLCTNH